MNLFAALYFAWGWNPFVEIEHYQVHLEELVFDKQVLVLELAAALLVEDSKVSTFRICYDCCEEEKLLTIGTESIIQGVRSQTRSGLTFPLSG